MQYFDAFLNSKLASKKLSIQLAVSALGLYISLVMINYGSNAAPHIFDAYLPYWMLIAFQFSLCLIITLLMIALPFVKGYEIWQAHKQSF